MEGCKLSYIPERLHSGERPDNPIFSIGERLYRRCSDADLDDPFERISLVDISVTRQGPLNGELCLPEDVLYNTDPEKNFEVYDLKVCTLEIQELTENGQYIKAFEEIIQRSNEQDEVLKVEIILRHKKEPCIYAHCAFEFRYNGQEMTYANYKDGLGKSGSARNKLRTKCKQEIAKMILKKIVRINWPE